LFTSLVFRVAKVGIFLKKQYFINEYFQSEGLGITDLRDRGLFQGCGAFGEVPERDF
jgi:hypothetical protein